MPMIWWPWLFAAFFSGGFIGIMTMALLVADKVAPEEPRW
jgi:hypothetical protein